MNKSATLFPAEVLELCEPHLINIEESESTERRIHMVQNKQTQEVFDVTQDCADKPSGQIPRLLAQVRSYVKESRNKVKQAVGIKAETQKKMESPLPDSPLIRPNFEGILKYWSQNNVPQHIREQLLTLMQQHHGSNLFGFLHSVACEVGISECDAVVPRQYTIAHFQTYPECPTLQELEDWISQLYSDKPTETDLRSKRLEEAQKYWIADKQREHKMREIQKPLGDFLIMLQFFCKEQNIPFNLKDIYNNVDILYENAWKLLQNQCIAWEDIEGLAIDMAEYFFEDEQDDEQGEEWLDALSDQWKVMDEQRKSERIFYDSIEQRRLKNNVSYPSIAASLRIQTQKQHEQSEHEANTTCKSPSGLVRTSFDIRKVSTVVPPACIVALVEPCKKEQENLKNLYTRERIQYLRQSGPLDCEHRRLQVRTLREYYGLTPLEVAQRLKDTESPYAGATMKKTTEWLHRVELKHAVLEEDGFAHLEKIIKELGEERTKGALLQKEALSQMPEKCRNFSTIAEGVHALKSYIGSWEKLVALLEGSSVQGLMHLADGTYIPSLPYVQDIFENFGITMPTVAQEDWYAQYARYLSKHRRYILTKPLARLLVTLMHTQARNIKDFEETFLDSHQTQYLIQTIERNGKVAFGRIRTILLAANIEPNAHQWAFAKQLCETGCTPLEAVADIRKQKEWSHIEIHPIHFPGCTWKELGIDSEANENYNI